MGDGYGDFNATEPKLKNPHHEVLWGDGETVISREDLIEAGKPDFDRERGLWSFTVIGSFGFPRVTLGCLHIRLRDDGKLVVTIV